MDKCCNNCKFNQSDKCKMPGVPNHVWFRDVDYCSKYEQKEVAAPTHEEIMTRWWRDKFTWFKVDAYRIYESIFKYSIRELGAKDKSWFIGRESAIVPPEVE